MRCGLLISFSYVFCKLNPMEREWPQVTEHVKDPKLGASAEGCVEPYTARLRKHGRMRLFYFDDCRKWQGIRSVKFILCNIGKSLLYGQDGSTDL